MSNLENPRFTERTSTNLGRSHRLPHVCTIMIYGNLGGYRLQETATFIYIYIIHIHQRPVWVSLIWEDPIAYRVFVTISINFYKPMSVQYIGSIAGVFAVAHIIIYIYLGKL